MKRILVPTDFSVNAENAVEVACTIAKKKQMSIKLLHVIEDPTIPIPSLNNDGNMLLEDNIQQTYILKLVERARSRLIDMKLYIQDKGIQVEENVVIDKIYNGILREIINDDIDLVVISNKGESDLEDFSLGSIAEKIIRLSAAPVLTTKNNADFKIRNILFASDFEEAEVEPIIERIIKFAEILEAKLNFVKIYTTGKIPTITDEQLEKIKTNFGISRYPFSFYEDKSEEEGIINFSKMIDADLIAMCTHGRTGLAHFFKDSIAEAVSHDSALPVLTYNINPKKIGITSKKIFSEKYNNDRMIE